MSEMLLTDDQKFSFRLPLGDESDWLSTEKRKPISRSIFIAVAASLLIHALVLQWNMSPYVHQPHVLPAKPLQITLSYAAPPVVPPIELEDAPLPKTLIEPAPLVEPKMANDVTQTQDLPQEKHKPNTIIQQQNKYRDDYLPPLNSDVITSQDNSSTAKHFNNVFDSRLRARLQNSRGNTARQSARGPTTLTNVHGDAMVEVDNGSCLMAATTAGGQPTNWYMTHCAGRKSEGEQMMERVNNDVKYRR